MVAIDLQQKLQSVKCGDSEGSKGGKGGGRQGGREDITCHNCSKHGHVKPDCWAKGGGTEAKREEGGRIIHQHYSNCECCSGCGGGRGLDCY